MILRSLFSFIIILVISNQTIGQDLQAFSTIEIGPHTTYLTGPIDNHGYVYYEAAIRKAALTEVQQRDNAAAILLTLIDPKNLRGLSKHLDFNEIIGLHEQEIGKNPFVSQYSYIKPFIKLRNVFEPEYSLMDISEEITEEFYNAEKRPWKSWQIPRVADWVDVNHDVMDSFRAASFKTQLYFPLKSYKSLLFDSTGLSDGFRDIIHAYNTRCMLAIGEQRFDQAWDDVLVLLRISLLWSRERGIFSNYYADLDEEIALRIICVLAAQPQVSILTQNFACIRLERHSKVGGETITE